MRRPWGVWLFLTVAWWCAGCIVVDSPTPETPAAPRLTATQAPAPLELPSANAIAIVTPTPAATPRASDTPDPAVAPPTRIASQTETLALPTGTLTPTAAAPVASPAVPPAATASPISIISFSIAPEKIRPGDIVALTWQTTGEKVTIYRLDPGGPLTEMHSVPASGSLTLLTPLGQRGRLDYVLYASVGNSTASAAVSAVILCTDTWFFPNPPVGCPGSSGAFVQMAAEHFERGLMLWTSAQNLIYILYADGGTPRWDQMPNAWFAGQMEADPNLTAPPGFLQPIRGFGVAWRTGYVSPTQVVRARLGWATDKEFSLNGAFQCDSLPKYNHCYISGPGGTVYVLAPERSGWQVWQGP